MEARNGVCEIVEVREGIDSCSRLDDKATSKQSRVYSVEDEINRLFQAIEIRSSAREETLWKSRMKRPMRASTSQASGIGISETSNLKQALRGLCILQASELAAMKRRSLKPAGSPGMSEHGTLKRFYRAVVAEANESGLPLDKGKGSVVEISLPEKFMPRPIEGIPECAEAPTISPSNQSKQLVPPKTKLLRAASQDKVVPLPTEAGKEMLDEFEQAGKLKASLRCLKGAALSKSIKHDMSQQDKKKAHEGLSLKKNDEMSPAPCSSSYSLGDRLKKSPRSTPSPTKLALRNKCLITQKEKIEPTVVPSASNPSVGNADDRSKAPIETSSAQCVKGTTSEVIPDVSKSHSVSSNAKLDGRLRSNEKGEISQSSKSSNGDFSSSTTSGSGESSSLSGSSRCGNRPHMSKDLRWEAIRHLLTQYGRISLKHFKLLKRLGSGDIGTVYLAQLIGTNGLFALKVMDNEFLARRKKSSRAETEREILQMLDHPFLPTLYAHFSTDKLSCLVMEYCPGGDLHVLRQKQPARNFSEQAARFYAAEVLLALEYLHMLGIVYRDLKPENILVREDGHIMLSDFDLSLRCTVNPTVLRPTSPVLDPQKKTSVTPCAESGCIDPFCLQPSWQASSCFTPRLLTATSKTQKLKPSDISLVTSFPQLIAEPTDARSNSFVGTHEYLAPEIIKGEGHGSAVDWWTLGVFLYELLYGRTPFRGSTNEETVANVLSKPLRFPDYPLVSFYARDLMRGLLVKEPENRTGFAKGATEIKQHPFFDGLNWALIRCAVPPERPKCRGVGTEKPDKKGYHASLEGDSIERIEFDLF